MRFLGFARNDTQRSRAKHKQRAVLIFIALLLLIPTLAHADPITPDCNDWYAIVHNHLPLDCPDPWIVPYDGPPFPGPTVSLPWWYIVAGWQTGRIERWSGPYYSLRDCFDDMVIWEARLATHQLPDGPAGFNCYFQWRPFEMAPCVCESPDPNEPTDERCCEENY